MAFCTHNSKAVAQLIRDGVIPANCKWFRLNIEAGRAITASFEVYVSQDQMDKIADAFSSNHDEVKDMIRDVILVSLEDTSRSINATI